MCTNKVIRYAKNIGPAVAGSAGPVPPALYFNKLYLKGIACTSHYKSKSLSSITETSIRGYLGIEVIIPPCVMFP